MEIHVNPKYIRSLSDELNEISRALGRIENEVAEARRGLKQQTEFDGYARELMKTQERLMIEQYKAAVLAQTLRNIGGIYADTEMIVEEAIEQKARPKVRILRALKFVELTEYKVKVDLALYGGKKDGGTE